MNFKTLKKDCVFILFLSLALPAIGQKNEYNLDIEKPCKSHAICHWEIKNENTVIQRDSIEKYEGKYSLMIESKTDSIGMSGVKNIINDSFSGEEISLVGFMKTEKVTKAYIYMIIGTQDNPIAYDLSTSVSGSNDWKELSVHLPYSSEATQITIACNIEGSGKIWLDDFDLKIDGKEIQNKTSFKKESPTWPKFSVEDLSTKDIEKIAFLGKLWGFLKYYHPLVSSGKYNWDGKLFEILPLIKNSEFNNKVEDWVKSLGNVPSSTNTENSLNMPKGEFVSKPDLNWFESNFVTPDLRILLERLLANKLHSNYYVDYDNQLNIPHFQNEKIYPKMEYSDFGLRLVSLFRYWNYIEYFYPYRYLISDNWDNTLQIYVPKMFNAVNEEEYTLTIAELAASTEDTHHILIHNRIMEEYFGKFKAPISVKFMNHKLIIVNSSKEHKVRAGDKILKIENEKIKNIESRLEKYCVGSNKVTTLREISKKAIRTNQDFINLDIQRGSIIRKVKLKTVPFYVNNPTPQDHKSIKEINQDTGYLNTTYLELKDYDSIFKVWKNKKTIIFDLRNYPRTNLARILPYLHDKKASFYQSTSTSMVQPGFFSYDPLKVFEDTDPFVFQGKIIILVNNNTQSKSEFSAMALQSYPNSLTIGTQSAGTDGDVIPVVLPGNLQTEITGLGIYGIDKKPTQKVGVKLDVIVKPSIHDIKLKNDVILERALKESLVSKGTKD